MGGYFRGPTFGSFSAPAWGTTDLWGACCRTVDKETMMGACLLALGAMAAASVLTQLNYRVLLLTPRGLAFLAASVAGAYYAHTQTYLTHNIRYSAQPVLDHPHVFGAAACLGVGTFALLKFLGYHAHVHLNLL